MANHIFGNNQSFSWAALGSSIAGSIAGAGMGEKWLFDGLGKTASPYAYSLAGANAPATMEDKWFGGARPDYLKVSMAAVANTVGRQFGENADSWFNSEAKVPSSNISVYNPATGERRPMHLSDDLLVYSWREAWSDITSFNVNGLRDGVSEELNRGREIVSDFGETILNVVNPRARAVNELETIHTTASPTRANIAYALGGVNSAYDVSAALARIKQEAVVLP